MNLRRLKRIGKGIMSWFINAIKVILGKSEEENLDFVRFLSKFVRLIQRMGLPGRNTSILIGPIIACYGLRIWQVKEIGFLNLLDKYSGNPSIWVGLFLFTTGIGTLMAQSKKRAERDLDYLERAKKFLDESDIRRRAKILTSRTLGIPIGVVATPDFEDFVRWSLDNEHIDSKCAEGIKKAWEEAPSDILS